MAPLTSLLCSLNAPEKVHQLRRIYVAPSTSRVQNCCSCVGGDGDRCSHRSDSITVVDILVTCNRPQLLHYQWDYSNERLLVVSPLSSSSSTTSTCETSCASSSSSFPNFPSCVRDIAWCPFKQGEVHTLYLAACRGQPLQLLDLYPSCHRSCFVSSIKVPHPGDGVCDPSAVYWWCTPDHSSAGLAAAGYHVAEDPTSIRFFDMQRVLEEGSRDGGVSPSKQVLTSAMIGAYSSPEMHRRGGSAGPVSALCARGQNSTRATTTTTAMKVVGDAAGASTQKDFPTTTSSSSSTSASSICSLLLFAGYYRHSHVEVIDVRHHCPAMVLRPTCSSRTSSSAGAPPAAGHAGGAEWRGGGAMPGGVMSICTDPDSEYLVYATGRGRCPPIYCWDLRQPLSPIACLLHPPCEVYGDPLQRSDLAVIPPSFLHSSPSRSTHTHRTSADSPLCSSFSSSILCATSSFWGGIHHDRHNSLSLSNHEASPDMSNHHTPTASCGWKRSWGDAEERERETSRHMKDGSKSESTSDGGGGLTFFSLSSTTTESLILKGCREGKAKSSLPSSCPDTRNISSGITEFRTPLIGATSGVAVLPPPPPPSSSAPTAVSPSPPPVLLAVLSSPFQPPPPAHYHHPHSYHGSLPRHSARIPSTPAPTTSTSVAHPAPTSQDSVSLPSLSSKLGSSIARIHSSAAAVMNKKHRWEGKKEEVNTHEKTKVANSDVTHSQTFCDQKMPAETDDEDEDDTDLYFYRMRCCRRKRQPTAAVKEEDEEENQSAPLAYFYCTGDANTEYSSSSEEDYNSNIADGSPSAPQNARHAAVHIISLHE